MSNVVWKNIVYKGIDYTGYYQVSNKAEIKSLARTVISKNGRKKFVSEKILKATITCGYYATTLSMNGVIASIKIHKAVALAFIPNPENKKCVNHIDSNRLNNAIENLEWVTHSENILHAIEHGNWTQMRISTRASMPKGESKHSSKLTEKQVIEIRAIQKQKTISDSKLGRIYGVSNVVIHKIRHRINWKHI